MKGLRPNIARYIGIMGNKNLIELKENVRKYEMIEFMITGQIAQTPSEIRNDIIQNKLNQINNPTIEENKISNEINELKQIIQKSINFKYPNKKCDLCGLNNHNTNNCFKKRTHNNIKCQICDIIGHTASNCKKNKWKQKTLSNMQSKKSRD